MVLDSDRHGSSEELAPGQRLSVRLPEVPTSGYRWQGADAFSAGGVLRLVSSDYELPVLGTKGGEGIRRLVFEAVAPGKVGIHLQKSRSGSAGSSAGQFDLSVHVR